MISVLLEFEPLEGKEKEFIVAWTQCTQVIYEEFGSLGSRLHQSSQGKFIAYAQWPSEDIYKRSSEWPKSLISYRDAMRVLLKNGKPNILHVLKTEVDLLKANTYI